MNVFDRFKSLFRRDRPVDRAGTSKSVAIIASALYQRFQKWFEPHNIFTRLNNETLATNETIFSAVSRLSNSIGTVPIKLLDGKFKPVTDHSLADLVCVQPNPNMSSFDFFRTMETLRNTNGNAYAMKDYDSRFNVRALWLLDPKRVTPVVDKNTRELWYEIEPDDGGQKYYVHNYEIIHVKHIHGYGYTGISPIDVLKRSIDFDRKVRELSLEQIDNAITASFILKLAGTVNKEKKEEILKNFSDFYRDNGGVLIQEMGVEIAPIDRKFIDTHLFEVEKITVKRVANVFTMPLHLLNEISGVQMGSVEQMDLGYIQGTLVPIVRQYEQELNRKLLSPETRKKGLYFKFNVNGLLRGDMKTRADFYFKGIRSGWFSPNEVRAYEDLPPVKGGDQVFTSRDLVPIQENIKQGGANREGIE